MSEYRKTEFQDKVQKILSGENTSIKRSRRSEETSMEDIKGICKYLKYYIILYFIITRNLFVNRIRIFKKSS